MKEVEKMNDCEMYVTLDIAKFPEEYRTGEDNPFMRVDQHQLDDVESWIYSLIPGDGKAYNAELIGKIPVTVALRIGNVLADTGCMKLKYIYPGRYVAIIWDYTTRPAGTVDEAARQEVLERLGYKSEAGQ
ncbi:hypothetical protein [Methanolobus sp. WCC5]|uniref:hypothetical protein n=1 Tax=Methanolobus sp. WCC5 TaxID=3125785 RepID=UPI00325309A6